MANVSVIKNQTMAGVPEKERGRGALSTFSRVGKYTLMRLLALGISLVVGIYLTIVIVNFGGYFDEIRISRIYDDIHMHVTTHEDLKLLPMETQREIIETMIYTEIKHLGLDIPFPIRSVRYFRDAITLDLGRARQMVSGDGSSDVRRIILERIPATLVLFGLVDLLLFFLCLFGSLFLSRRYGSRLDKTILGLAPTSAAPGWFYGIFILLLFAFWVPILPFGGMVEAPPPACPFAYAWSLLQHLILPVIAMLISAVFMGVYAWRTFFLIYSSEDYVDMAKAKGLKGSTIEREHILRPALPPIITSFAFMIIGLWGGAIIFERIFNWPGIGRMFFEAITYGETAVIVGGTVISAYLLMLVLFLLDIFYALVDPRVKVGGEGRKV